MKKLTYGTSQILSDDKFARVLDVLQNPKACKDRYFKHWVLKSKKSQLMDLPGLGVKDALVVQLKTQKEFHQEEDQVHLFSE